MTISNACVSVGRTGGIPSTRRDHIPGSVTAKKRISKLTNHANLELGGGNNILFKSATQQTPIFSKLIYFINITCYQFNRSKYFCPGKLLNNSNFLLNRGVTTCVTGSFLNGKISNYLININVTVTVHHYGAGEIM